MSWMKALALLVAASVLVAPTPGLANGAATPMTIQDYAAREAQAADLEGFTGGWHGVVLTLLLVGLVAWIVYEVWYHEHRDEAKPAEPPPQPKP